MSSTGRSDVREPDDFYATPAWCTDAILPHLSRLPGDPSLGHDRRMLLEPASGSGAIVERLWAHGVPRARVMAIEIDSVRAAAFAEKHEAWVNCWDFLAWARMNAGEPDPLSFDCVITNPPFRLAMEFVVASLALVAENGGEVAMLLRLNWLASQKRASFHREHPSDVYILPRRPSFTANGKTDSIEYAWFVWGAGRGGRWSILDDARPGA